MNINSILSSTYPVSLYEKEKDTRNTGFMDALRKSAEEAFAQRRAGFIETPEKTTPAKKEYSYTVTEEQAEYFREKYGEDFDDETVGKLFDELYRNGILSDKDSRYSSGKSWAYSLGVFTTKEEHDRMMQQCKRRIDEYGNIVVTLPFKINYDELQFYDDHEYKNAYNRFDYEYDKEVKTWEDYLEKRLAFVEYLRNCDRSKMSDFLDDSGNLWLTDKMLDEMEADIRKASDVIKQIFGRQNSDGDSMTYNAANEVTDLLEKYSQQMEEEALSGSQPRDDLTIITEEQLRNLLKTNYKPEMIF